MNKKYLYLKIGVFLVCVILGCGIVKLIKQITEKSNVVVYTESVSNSTTRVVNNKHSHGTERDVNNNNQTTTDTSIESDLAKDLTNDKFVDKGKEEKIKENEVKAKEEKKEPETQISYDELSRLLVSGSTKGSNFTIASGVSLHCVNLTSEESNPGNLAAIRLQIKMRNWSGVSVTSATCIKGKVTSITYRANHLHSESDND